MKIYVVHVITESCRHHYFTFAKEPEIDCIVKLVCDAEEIDDELYIKDTSSVNVVLSEIIN